MPNNSLKVIHDTIFTKGESAYDLVYKIDNMYQNAWSRLVVVGGVILAIATIVIPWWLSYLRTKQAKVDKENDRILYEKKIDELKVKLNEDFDIKISNELAKYNEDVERAISGSKGAHFYLLGDSHLNRNDYAYALVNFITAIKYSLAADDLGNVKGILLRLTQHCIPFMSIKEIKASERVYSFSIDKTLNEINSADTERLLFDGINAFKLAVSRLVPPEER